MISKIAYLTSPDPGRYIFNFQPFGSDVLTSVEIAPDQMRNILNDGITHWLRNSLHRVHLKTPELEIADGSEHRA
jgi:hypothetical protein